MFLKEKTDALILVREDHGESDRLLTLLTDRFGKIKATARGEKKLLSKLRAGLNLFNWSEIELVSGRGYPIITSAKIQSPFINIGQDWKKFLVAQKMMQEIDALMPWQMPDENVWLLSLGALHALNQMNRHYQRLYYYFLWTLLSSLGYQIDLSYCARCREKLAGNCLIAPDGIICAKCGFQEDHQEEISLNTIKILRLIAQKNKYLLGRIKTNENDQDNLKKITNFFLESVKQKQSPEKIIL